jgi:hypothetical protein
MSIEYDNYLKQHIANVRKGYFWIKRSLPEVLIPGYDYSWYIDFHDDSKTIPDEYEAYDNYFYGKQTKAVKDQYKKMWLEHIHRNPHHWQYWVLHNDDGSTECLDMEYPYIIEMICDWWSFSWANDNVFELFEWYELNKKNMKFSKKTRKTVEDILEKLETKLLKVRGPKK